MNRRALILGGGAALALGFARPARSAIAFGPPWTRSPAITVISSASDARPPLVRDAVAFWNRTLEGLGSAFRLGAVTAGGAVVPTGAMRSLSPVALSRGPRPPMPAWMSGAKGAIAIVLSDEDFVSFTMRWPAEESALIGIKNAGLYPLTLGNVARNVIAHELGHAIGLGHNDDPKLLMCGRPAPCRPDAFAAASEHYFPLAEDETALLLTLYPRDWRGTGD